MDFIKQLKEYFNNTPRNVVEKEWHKYDKYNSIGLTVNEFLKEYNTLPTIHHPSIQQKDSCASVIIGCLNDIYNQSEDPLWSLQLEKDFDYDDLIDIVVNFVIPNLEPKVKEYWFEYINNKLKYWNEIIEQSNYE